MNPLIKLALIFFLQRKREADLEIENLGWNLDSFHYVVFMHLSFLLCKMWIIRGTWVAQLVEHLTLALVMISWFESSSPASGSVLTARSLKPASDSVSLSLCPSPTHVRSLSLSLSQKINKR